MRGFDALRALLGHEYSIGSWFWEPVWEARTGRSLVPFGKGKVRPVVLATTLGPDAVLFPRSRQHGGFQHGPHRHDLGSCSIDQHGWVKLHLTVPVESLRLNEETYSCEEPEGSPLLDAIRAELRP